MKLTIEIPDKNTKEVQMAVDNIQTDSEVQKLNAVCFWLIRMCVKTKATTATITQEKIHNQGKQLGDWKIEVTKV